MLHIIYIYDIKDGRCERPSPRRARNQPTTSTNTRLYYNMTNIENCFCYSIIT